MNRFFVFSDLHGDMGMLRMAIARAEKEQADTILFAGDLGLQHSAMISQFIKLSSIPFLLVSGNCDSPWEFSDMQMVIPPQYRTIPFGSRTIFLSHGHRFGYWKEAPIDLLERDIFITGHTHIPRLNHAEGSPWEVNPGSASRPRSGSEPSYAIITDEEIRIKEIMTGLTIPRLVCSLKAL